MTLTDILLIAALAAFVGAWWVRKTPARRIVLIASAAAAVVIGIAGYLDDRWQNAAGAFIGLAFLAGLGGVVLKNRITRTDRTGGIPWFSGIFITIGFAAVVFTILVFPVWPLPKPTGQYAVGVRTFEIVDASRKGVFAAKPDEPRRLLVRVWYPAGNVAGRQVAPYFTKAEAGTTARAIGYALLQLILNHIPTDHIGRFHFIIIVSLVVGNSANRDESLANGRDRHIARRSHRARTGGPSRVGAMRGRLNGPRALARGGRQRAFGISADT